MIIQAAICAAAAFAAQDNFEPGDLLIAGAGFGDVFPSSMGHYRSNGDFVQEIYGTGEYWGCAAALEGGLVATAYHAFDAPDGVNILSEDGFEALTFELTELSEFGSPGDISVFADGTLAIIDSHGWIMLYEADGTYIDTLDCPATQLAYSDVDSQDRLWVVDPGNMATPPGVYVMSRAGAVLDSVIFDQGFEPGDVVANGDGTFWMAGFGDGEVYLFDLDGQVLEQFTAGYFDHMFGSIAVGLDGTIWTANNNAKIIRRFEPDGTMIDEFTAQHSGFALGLIDVVPPASCGFTDCNGDNDLNILDFICFQSEWQAQTQYADCDANGLYNILDFICFQQAFVEGCP